MEINDFVYETALYSKMLSKAILDNSKSVYTYDKISSKAYRASLMSVCCEDDIYLKLRLLVDLEDIKWMKFTNG